MHPRIRELAEQATTEEADGFKYFDREKFAELIVRACADVLHQDAAFMPELGVYAHDMVVNMGFKYE
jgi:hypothetical protein